MKSLFIIFFTALSFTQITHAQNALAKIEYAEAETDYQAENYIESLAHLETVKEMLGSTNAKVMYLEILNRDHIQDARALVSKLGQNQTKEELKYFAKNLLTVITGYDITVASGYTELESKEYYIEKFQQATELLKMMENDQANDELTIEKYVTEIQAIEEMSSTYISSFENSVPLEKLTEIYNINKKYKELNVGSDNLKNGIDLLLVGNFAEAEKALKSSCEMGNLIACERVKEAQEGLQKKEVVQKILESIYDDLVLVEGGSFEMGGATVRNESEDPSLPVHTVNVKDFKIGRYEVTFKQYVAVINSDRLSVGGNEMLSSVTGVSYNSALEFIEKLNELTGLTYRLPTEAEWEYAARGGRKSENYEFAGSNSIREVGIYKKNYKDGLAYYGKKKPNELGIYDMSGNLWEWCQDYYEGNYYAKSPLDNPTGPIEGSEHVLRGGSLISPESDCTTIKRNSASSSETMMNYGFRLLLMETSKSN